MKLKIADQSDVWITDSGASRHITYRREWFTTFSEVNKGGVISLGDNKECDILGEGTVLIEKFVDGVWYEARIENVLYVPDIKKNLFSVGVCTTRGHEVIFKNKMVKIMNNGQTIASGIKQENEIYRMLFRESARKTDEAYVASANMRV